MPNPRGNPESLEPMQPKGEESMTASISFRCTEAMKEEVRAHDDPAQFCRDAIQKALDEEKKK